LMDTRLMQPMVNIALRAARQASEQIERALERLDLIKSEQGSVAKFLNDTCKSVEKNIAQVIQKAYPHHSVMGEYSGLYEAASTEGPTPCHWQVHTLDSVTNFSNALPSFALCLVGRVKDKVEHALILNPITGEEFTASRGQGAQLNGRRLRVGSLKSLDGALIGTGHLGRPSDKKHLEMQLDITRAIVEAGASTFSTGSVALNLAYTAAGRLDAMLQPEVHAEELEAGLLILQEAGGLAADFSGGANYRNNGQLVAGNPKIFKSLLTTVNGISKKY
jgi:myo-inositol-1(or 4)-monophosphatase